MNSTSGNNISERIDKLKAELAELSEERGDSTARLIAVSKTQPVSMIREGYNAGLRRFGENKIQELISKTPCLPTDIEWHFIGHLQRNKSREAVRHATWIHSVDSLALLQRIDRVAGSEKRLPKILIQVNISGEKSKNGIIPADCPALLEAARNCENIRTMGLMTMAPLGATLEELHHTFAALRRLRDQVSSELNLALPELSMGMSNDYQIALREGATMVRIGSAIFGKRQSG